MIDAGQTTKNDIASESAAAYLAGLTGNTGKVITLDFCIITHAHTDHYIGLKYFNSYNINVEKMYVNAYYNNVKPDGKVSLSTRLQAMKDKGLIKNIYSIETGHPPIMISCGDATLKILPPIFPGSKTATEAPEGEVNIRSMICTLDHSNYKYIFMGDVYEKDGQGLSTIRNTDLYKNCLVPGNNQTVIYKISHHGRRNNKNYNKSEEQKMYDCISKHGKNTVYCIANRNYTKSNSTQTAYDKYATNSLNLQNLWYNNSPNVYFNTGYKKTGTSETAYYSVPIERYNGISALTSITSLSLYY